MHHKDLLMAQRLPRSKLEAPSLSSEEDGSSARSISDSCAEYWVFKSIPSPKVNFRYFFKLLRSTAMKWLLCINTFSCHFYECFIKKGNFPFFFIFLFFIFLFFLFLFHKHETDAETFHVLWNWPTHFMWDPPLFPVKNHSTGDIKGMWKKLVLSCFCSHTQSNVKK